MIHVAWLGTLVPALALGAHLDGIRGVSLGRGMCSAMPDRRTAQASNASCSTPEIETPHASECPTVGT